LVTKAAAHNRSLVKFLDISLHEGLLINNIKSQDARVLSLRCVPRSHGGPRAAVGAAVRFETNKFRFRFGR